MAAPAPPASPVIHASISFKQAGYGWKESFYTLTGGLDAAMKNLEALAVSRDTMVALEGNIVRLDVKYVNARNAADGEAYSNTDTLGTDSDWPWSAVLADLASDPGLGAYHRSYPLRGVAANANVNGAAEVPIWNASFSQAVDDYRASLCDSFWCLRCQDQGVAAVPITGIAQTMNSATPPAPVNGQVTVTTAAAHGIPATAVYAVQGNDHTLGQPYFVLVEHLKWQPPPAAQPSDVILDPVSNLLRRAKRINGRKRVIAVPSTTTLVVAADYQPGAVLLPGGLLRVETFTYPVIHSLTLIRDSKRNTGRGISKPRAGKRRARVFAP